MKWWRKLSSLTNRELLFLLKTFLLLGFVRLGLWVLPYQKLLYLLKRISDRQNGDRERELNDNNLNKIVRAVNISTRYMPGGAKCLARALTTQVIMKRQGYSPQLRLGVAQGEQGKIEAHAWIEYQGLVVIGDLQNLSRFIPLSPFEKT